MSAPSPFKEPNELIFKLATFMFQRKQSGKRPYTLLLGAGASVTSGAPSWFELCDKIASDFKVNIPEHADPIHYIVHDLLHPKANSLERHAAVAKHVPELLPSIGFRHLAQLIAGGYIDTVLTTNWDPLIEIALSRLLPVNHYKVLVRGEVPDNVIADYLQSCEPRVKIVKMHGDLASRILLARDDETNVLSTALKSALDAVFANDLIVVGSQLKDIDILAPVLTSLSKKMSLYYVRPDEPAADSVAETLAHLKVTTFISGDDGQHDSFFTKLNLYIQKKHCDGVTEEKRIVEKEMLLKQERGRGYVNYGTITEMVEHLATKVKKLKADLILFIDDPTAPGGMEVMKRMKQFVDGISIEVLEVAGESGNRILERKVRSDKSRTSKLKSQSPNTVVIVDAITFSGNTLKLAQEKARQWWPHAVVKTCVLFISQHLEDKLADEHKHPLHDIMSMAVTDRFEIFFPWGVTQTTGDFDRKFKDIEGVRSVHISKRPWGTIEILSDEKFCSVRLLTLEADQKLSFQRHVCRDELFVALDDNIGLDVCAENLLDPADPFDPRIKSLILEKGDYILIPRGIWHRSKASKERVRLLEIAFGLYDQSGDIERLFDNFGRTYADGSK